MKHVLNGRAQLQTPDRCLLLQFRCRGLTLCWWHAWKFDEGESVLGFAVIDAQDDRVAVWLAWSG